MLKQRIAAVLVLLSMLLVTPVASLPAAAASPYCGCGKTGNYVDPVAKDPTVKSPKDVATSPKGTYTVSATPGNPTTITVTNNTSHKTLFNEQISGDVHWYFGPDDTHLALDILSQQMETVQLLDLTGHYPSIATWQSGPSAVSSSNIGFSPKGKYLLYSTVTGSSQSLTIVPVSSNKPVLNQSGLALMSTGWGFSPDEDRFLSVSAQGATTNATLYDLTKTGGQQRIWSDSSAAGSIGYVFSPKGHYLLEASVTNGNHTSLSIYNLTVNGSPRVFFSEFDFGSAPVTGKNKFGSVGWGFSPNDSNFVYAVASDQGPSLTIVYLGSTPAKSGTIPLSNFDGAFWRFSPCGDVLGLVVQTSANYAQVSLFVNGTISPPAASEQYNVASLGKDSLKTTDAGQVVTVSGQDHVLLAFDSSCDSSGGSGGGDNGGGGGNGGNTGGSGGSGGGSGGGGGWFPLPPPATFSYLTAIDVDAVPLVLIGGTSGVLNVTTTGSGQMKFASSNTSALTAPGTTTVSGNGTQQVTSVSFDTLSVVSDTQVTVTVTAYSGGIPTKKSVDVIVIPPCGVSPMTNAPSSSPTSSAFAITAFIGSIFGGGAPGGPGRNFSNVTMTFDQMYAIGGDQVTGTVTVAGGLLPRIQMTVDLTSTDPTVASVPDSVTIPSGSRSTTFTVQTHDVSDATWVAISGSQGLGGDGVPAKLLVLPPSAPASVAFDPASVVGGNLGSGTVTLSAPPVACTGSVNLSSDNPDVAVVPTSLPLSSGTTTVGFAVNTNKVDTDTDVKITASNDNGSASGTLTVTASGSNQPPPTSSDLLAWGRNNEGELGNGSNSDSNLPVAVSNLSGVTSMAGGDYYSIALQNDGTVWAWGDNGHHFLGDGTSTPSNTPVQVSGLSNITAISARRLHSLALDNDGNVWAWGENGSGQLGDGSTNPPGSEPSTPVQVQGLTNVQGVSAGGFFSLALDNDGNIWAWGANDAGQLGNGSTSPSDVPVQVIGDSTQLPKFKLIAAGFNQALAVDVDGNLWAWGGNVNGNLGIGTADNNAHAYPVQVSGISAVTAIAAYYNHSLAVSGGSVYAWGNGSAGELGDGTNSNHYSPNEVPDLTNVTEVAAGGYHSLARTSGGAVYAWGDNSDGRLGNGNDTASNTPVQVLDSNGTSPLTGVSQIAAGDRVSLALVGDDSSNPPPSVDLTSLDVSPQEIFGGTSATGTVTLTGPAPAGGTEITLSGSNGAEVPSTVTVPENETQATFGVGTIGVTADQTASVTASLNSILKQVTITLPPDVDPDGCW